MWMYLPLLAVLTGTVLDETNRPIAGAVVVILPASFREEPATGTSDAQGRFEVALSKPGPFRVEAHAPGYVPFRAREVDPEKPLTIVLGRGGEAITGLVRDGTTLDPLQGAIVETRIGEAGVRVSTSPRLGLVEAVSDERGGFRLEGLGKGSYFVSASAPGYGRATKSSAVTGDTLEFFLFSGSGVYGRVLDEKENPVESALVSVENEDRMTRMSGPITPQQSDSDGRFALLGLEPGRYRLFVRHADYAPATRALELSKESDAEIELVLTPGVAVSGRLIDEEDVPLSGKVSVRSLDGGSVGWLLRSHFTTETNTDGVFTLDSLPPGDHTLLVESRGFAAKEVETVLSGRAKQEDLGDIVLETGLAIAGKVVSESGAPITAATVHAFPSFRGAMGAVRERIVETETDGEGRFVIAGLLDGAYNVIVGAPGFGHAEPTMAETGSANVTIILKLAGSIRGTVVDPEGRPVAGFRVMARSPDERGFGAMRHQEEPGTFVLDSVAEGEYVVEIVAADYLPEVSSSVRVTAGNISEVGTIRLRRGARLQGSVVNGSEEPIPGATVYAVLPGQRRYDFGDNAATTDRLGRFQIGGLADGRVEVVASHPSYAETRLEAVEVDSASGSSDVRIVLRRGGTVEGYVRSRDGTEIAGRRIQAASREALHGPRESASAQTAADGYFQIENLPPGNVVVELVQVEPTTMYAVQRREVEVTEGETAYVEFQSRRILVQGTIRRGGSPLPGAGIEFVPSRGRGLSSVSFGTQGPPPSPSGPRYLMAMAGDDGYFELLVDEPGEYRLSASVSGLALPGRTVAVPDVESFLLDLDFDGALVSGRVVDKETEAPIPGAFVSARSLKSATTSSTSLQVGPDGLFEFELEPGEFTLVVQADGYGTIEEKLTVGEGGRSDVILALSRGLSIKGRVSDRNGRGLGSIRVMAVEDSPDVSTPPVRMGFAMTIPDGSFSLADLAPGRYNVLVGEESAGFAFLPSVPSGTEGHELVLRPGGKVEVLVVDENGAPVASAVVAVAAIEGRKVRGVQSSADENGRLVLPVPAGNLTIKAVVMNGPEGLDSISVSEGATARVQIVLVQTASSRSRR